MLVRDRLRLGILIPTNSVSLCVCVIGGLIRVTSPSV